MTRDGLIISLFVLLLVEIARLRLTYRIIVKTFSNTIGLSITNHNYFHAIFVDHLKPNM